MHPSRLTRSLLALVGALGVALLNPAFAAACTVCFSAKNKENQVAYLVTTGFLTFLPLGLVGLLLLWIRKRSRELDAEPPAFEAGQPRLEALHSEE